MLLQSQGRRLIVCPGIAPAPYGVARPALLGVLGIKPGLGNATIAAHQSRGIGHAAHLLGSPRRLESRHAVTNSSPFRRGPVSAPSGPCPPGTWGLSPRAPRSPPRRRGTARPSSLPSRGRPPPALARSGRPESRASPSRYGGGVGLASGIMLRLTPVSGSSTRPPAPLPGRTPSTPTSASASPPLALSAATTRLARAHNNAPRNNADHG